MTGIIDLRGQRKVIKPKGLKNRVFCVLMCAAVLMNFSACGSISQSNSGDKSDSTESLAQREKVAEPITADEQLTDREYTVYVDLVEGITERETPITLSISATKNELANAYAALLVTSAGNMLYMPREYTYNYNVETGLVLDVQINYSVSAEQAVEMNIAVRDKADEILSGITPEMSQTDIVAYFHDTIITSCEYSETDNSDNVYGCLVEGKAVCEGYSRAMQYLCGLADVRCIIVTGVADEDHMWNMVEIDGQWYHIDLTWDDPRYNPPIEDYVSHTYHNITTEQISADHYIDESNFTVPVADATAANYYVYTSTLFDSYEEALNYLPKVFSGAVQQQKYDISVRFSDRQAFEKTCTELFSTDNTDISDVIDSANELLDTEKISKSNLTYMTDDVFLIIKISFETE